MSAKDHRERRQKIDKYIRIYKYIRILRRGGKKRHSLLGLPVSIENEEGKYTLFTANK